MLRSATQLADQATENAQSALRSTQRLASGTLDRVADSAEELARRGIDAMRQRSERVRERALDASNETVSYIQGEPVKAVLIAAALGAALLALGSMLSRSSRQR